MASDVEIREATKRRTRRRGDGEGSIYRRPDGRWLATITIGYNAAGKRVRRTVYGWTQKHVQNELTKLQSSKLSGTLMEPSRSTVAQFLDRWLSDVARVTVKSTTYASYQGIVKNHIKPWIGGIGLQKLTPVHVQSLYSELERDGSSPRLRQLTHAVLRRALKQALRWGVVARNVCDAVDPPRIPKSDIRPLDSEQVGELLAAAKGNRLEALYWVAIGSGLRLGELFGLHWRDVDLAAGTVSVRHTLTEVSGKLDLTEPKSAKSRRLVTLPQQAVSALVEHRKRMLVEGFAGVEAVFCNKHGGYLRRSHFHRNDYKPLLKRAELPNIRFHDLRHTSATLLFSQGVHPKVVQERLGHSNISLTMDTYSHVMPGMQKDAARKLDAMMIPAPSAARGNKLATLTA